MLLSKIKVYFYKLLTLEICNLIIILQPSCCQFTQSSILFVPDILKGSVGILNNYNLCHIKTINWDEIITDAPQSRYVYVYNFKEPERECSPCHESCQV